MYFYWRIQFSNSTFYFYLPILLFTDHFIFTILFHFLLNDSPLSRKKIPGHCILDVSGDWLVDGFLIITMNSWSMPCRRISPVLWPRDHFLVDIFLFTVFPTDSGNSPVGGSLLSFLWTNLWSLSWEQISDQCHVYESKFTTLLADLWPF